MPQWKRSTGDFVESHCGRWKITPIYGGLTRPERYELWLDGKRVGSGSTQRECKADAKQDEEIMAKKVARKETEAKAYDGRYSRPIDLLSCHRALRS